MTANIPRCEWCNTPARWIIAASGYAVMACEDHRDRVHAEVAAAFPFRPIRLRPWTP